MSHDFHQGPADAVLYDNCAECDERAANPLNGLLNLDAANFARLHRRVRDVEWDVLGEHYRSRNEQKLGTALHRLLILIERHPEVVK